MNSVSMVAVGARSPPVGSVGILRIAPDVTPALADATIEHIQLLGSLRAPAEVEARLADRIDRGLSMDYA